MKKPKLEDFTFTDYKAYSEALEEFILSQKGEKSELSENDEVEFEVGEIVEVVVNFSGHTFNIFDRIKLLKLVDDGFNACRPDEDLTWWVSKDEIKKLETK